MSFLIAMAAAATLSDPLDRPILCDGLNGKWSTTCDITLAFQGCTQSVRMHWEPVRLPIAVGKIQAARNWCDVTWESDLRVVQKKVDPKVCAKLVDQFAVSLKRFGDSSVVQGPCLPNVLGP